MHLRSITLKGFKSFPDRTRLEFGPGVSVIVGPNGSGKSNVTDAVLWAMGEQSPLAVRGQSMQDVIFGGAQGQQPRRYAEVELVIDNGDGAIDVDLAEVAILRRLDRTGEGEYRINGARCRLVDVLEVLSDTGLGKEGHSIVSQGRVESVVSSKPRDRRLLIEEAAGLGKHRKRRRRAQLKLARTQDNLDRALDVEREARGRLRPLKRQAEAAQLHERLDRQSLEARLALAQDDARARQVALGERESDAAAARERRGVVEGALSEIAARRQRAEADLAGRGERHELLAGRVFAARSAVERAGLRLEQARAAAEALRARAGALADEPAEGEDGSAGRPTLELAIADARELLGAADGRSQRARADRTAAEREAETARAAAISAEAELAALERFLHVRAGTPAGARALGEELEVAPGYELAVAAALGGRLGAAVAADRRSGAELLDRAGERGGSALVPGGEPASSGAPPVAGAEPLRARVRGAGSADDLVGSLLADAWVVEDLEAVPEDFAGIAVTREGRAWFGGFRELRQAPAGGEDALLAERGRRDRLEADTREAEDRRRAAEDAATTAAEAVAAADRDRDAADEALRTALRRRDEASERELLADRREAERERGRRAAALAPAAERVVEALVAIVEEGGSRAAAFEAELEQDRAAGEGLAEELRACAHEEAERQGELRAHAEEVTAAEVAAQQARDQAADADAELAEVAGRLEVEPAPAAEPLPAEEREALAVRVERLARRREQLGPVNPLAQREYAEAVEHVESLETQRHDLEAALRELGALIAETDRRIRDSFEETFAAAAANFEELAEHLFPGGRGRLRLVREEAGPRPVLGGEEGGDEPGDAEPDDERGEAEDDLLGVEIEITPAGKGMKRLSLLSGGEKSLTALAFLFAVFLARPCPFYVLDEVEAALDDLNMDRFLGLLRRYAGRAQFIVVTHQKRTMEAADTLYGVSMGDDGISRVVSRRLPDERPAELAPAAHA